MKHYFAEGLNNIYRIDSEKKNLHDNFQRFHKRLHIRMIFKNVTKSLLFKILNLSFRLYICGRTVRISIPNICKLLITYNSQANRNC